MTLSVGYGYMGYKVIWQEGVTMVTLVARLVGMCLATVVGLQYLPVLPTFTVIFLRIMCTE